jgi:hypothetical protein
MADFGIGETIALIASSVAEEGAATAAAGAVAEGAGAAAASSSGWWTAAQYAGTALSAYGTYSQGQAQAAQAKAAANAANYNAAVGRNNAQLALEEGNANEESQRRHARAVLGQQRAALAEAGIGLEGTGGDLYEQSASGAELDAQNIRYGAQLQSTSYLNQSNLEMAQAKQYSRNAANASTASYIGAGSSLLSGYGNYVRDRATIDASKLKVKL